MTKIVMVASGKGGTGKTTTAAMLGRGLAEHFRVGLLDLDVTGPNLAMIVGINSAEKFFDEDWFYPAREGNLELFSPSFLLPEGVAIAWSGDRRRELIHELLLKVKWNDPEILICDSPPGTGDEIKAMLMYAPKIDGVVVVTNTTREGVSDASRLCSLLRADRYREKTHLIGTVLNMEYMELPKGKTVPLLHGDVDVEKVLDLPIIARVPFMQEMRMEPYLGAMQVILHHLGMPDPWERESAEKSL